MMKNNTSTNGSSKFLVIIFIGIAISMVIGVIAVVFAAQNIHSLGGTQKNDGSPININEPLSSEDALAIGRPIYISRCSACHKYDGSGGIGPSLIDDEWIHGSSDADIYKAIELGFPKKGMVAWGRMLEPYQINALVTYVRSLKINEI